MSELLVDGDSFILDAGTTCTFVADSIRGQTSVSRQVAHYAIMTHNQAAFRMLAELGTGSRINLVSAGGALRQ